MDITNCTGAQQYGLEAYIPSLNNASALCLKKAHVRQPILKSTAYVEMIFPTPIGLRDLHIQYAKKMRSDPVKLSVSPANAKTILQARMRCYLNKINEVHKIKKVLQ